MTQYINKDALVAEMKRRIFNLEQLGDRKFIETHFTEQFRFIKVYEGIIDFINTLEVKEVDLEEENPIEGEFPYTNPSDTLQGEIENIFGKLSINGIFTSTREGFSEVISHFVKWQHNKEEEMKEALQTEYEKGRFNMREEIMKDAVDGEYWDGSIYLDNRPTEYKDGDKVKIIIVKED